MAQPPTKLRKILNDMQLVYARMVLSWRVEHSRNLEQRAHSYRTMPGFCNDYIKPALASFRPWAGKIRQNHATAALSSTAPT